MHNKPLMAAGLLSALFAGEYRPMSSLGLSPRAGEGRTKHSKYIPHMGAKQRAKAAKRLAAETAKAAAE